MLPATGGDLLQALCDALLKPVMDRPFLRPSRRASTHDKHFIAARRGTQLRLDARANPLPRLGRLGLLESAQQAFRRSDDVPAVVRLQPLDLVLTDEPAVQHPDPIGGAVAAFHGLDDLA